MKLPKRKGNRIRASDKSLVFTFCASSLLLLFVCVLVLLNIKTILLTDWKSVTSWRLEPTDKQPQGTKLTLSLREMEKQIGRDWDSLMDPLGRNMTVKECVERYVATKTGVKPSTKTGYKTVMNKMETQAFYHKKVREIKTSDAKLFLIKLQQEDGLKYSTITTIRGVLRPAFQMAMDDDIIEETQNEIRHFWECRISFVMALSDG